jgi:hypothetical protein
VLTSSSPQVHTLGSGLGNIGTTLVGGLTDTAKAPFDAASGASKPPAPISSSAKRATDTEPGTAAAGAERSATSQARSKPRKLEKRTQTSGEATTGKHLPVDPKDGDKEEQEE